jgi:hypothetical protein
MAHKVLPIIRLFLLGPAAALAVHCATPGITGQDQRDARPDGQLAACTDGVQNVDETDVDCGGPDCDPCPDGSTCITWSDCQSGVCAQGLCGGAACDDGVRNGNETDVDCGGPDCSLCPNGSACVENSDCISNICTNNRCVGPECSDGAQNGSETDVDCGGPDCAPCPDGSGCNDPTDCESGVCILNICVPAQCGDGVLNGNETDLDCGGPDCGPCPPGSDCNDHPDCQSGICDQGTCTTPDCTDTVLNGNETDVDCGGPDCPGCHTGQNCNTGSDCLSGLCPAGVCESDSLSKTITVSSTDPAVLTDFQVYVELNTGNFDYVDSTADGRDIRFSTDGVSFNIPYWIQTWDTAGTSRLWAKVPSIPASNSVDIYLLYGDTGLTDNSDGDGTFEFFDDFEDGTYTNKWDAHGSPATLTESGGEIHLVGSSNWEFIGGQTSFTGPVVIEAEVMMTGTSCGLVLADAASVYRYTFRASGSNTGTTYDPDVSSSNSWEDSSYPGVPYTTGAYHDLMVTARINGSSIELMEYCNGTNCNSTPRTYNQTGITAFVPGISSWSSGHDARARLFFVRKYTAYSVTATVN